MATILTGAPAASRRDTRGKGFSKRTIVSGTSQAGIAVCAGVGAANTKPPSATPTANGHIADLVKTLRLTGDAPTPFIGRLKSAAIPPVSSHQEQDRPADVQCNHGPAGLCQVYLPPNGSRTYSVPSTIS